MPFFHYDLLGFNKPNYLWICDGSVKLHKIDNEFSFYTSFGYTKEMQKNNVEPEFYIWENYCKETALKEKLCKQAIIIDYLNIHSLKFRREYAEHYQNWIGTCNSKKLNLSKDCNSCKMHPKNKLHSQK